MQAAITALTSIVGFLTDTEPFSTMLNIALAAVGIGAVFGIFFRKGWWFLSTFTRFLNALIIRLPLSDVFSAWIDYDYMPF